LDFALAAKAGVMKRIHTFIPVRRLRALQIAVGVLTAITLGETTLIVLIARGW
jgi:hypothetical protein